MTFEEWREKRTGAYSAESLAQEAWNHRGTEVAELQNQIEEEKRLTKAHFETIKTQMAQLAPGPCGVAGHRNADWFERGEVLVTEKMAIDLGNSMMEGQFLAAVSFCLACRREQEIRREEREQVLRIAAKKVMCILSLDDWNEFKNEIRFRA